MQNDISNSCTTFWYDKKKQAVYLKALQTNEQSQAYFTEAMFCTAMFSVPHSFEGSCDE